MPSNIEVHARHMAEDRINQQNADPGLKMLRRLDRKIMKDPAARRAYEGYTIQGRSTILVHMQHDGERKTIEITRWGTFKRYPRKCVTVKELMAE